MNEARIEIGGVELSVGQAMTVRVALDAFACSLRGGLGDDDHGRAMVAAYRQRIAEVMNLIRVSSGCGPAITDKAS